MPSSPGVRRAIMQDHAGTVMGGTMLRSGPHNERSRSFVRVGMSSANCSKSRPGVPQSNPITATRDRPVTRNPPIAQLGTDAVRAGLNRVPEKPQVPYGSQTYGSPSPLRHYLLTE